MWTPHRGTVALHSVLAGRHYSGYLRIPFLSSSDTIDESERWSCRPFLPSLFANTPPSLDHPSVKAAIGSVNSFCTNRFSQGDIDSLSVAVVAVDGALYEKNFDVMHGNESVSYSPITSHSIGMSLRSPRSLMH